MIRTSLFNLGFLAALGMALNLPNTANAALKHRWSFTGNLTDSVGGANGTLVDPTNLASYGGGQLLLSGNNGELANQNPFAVGAYVNLPNGIISALGTRGTIELWVTVDTNWNWAEVYSFGNSRLDTGGENISAGFGKYVTLIPDTGDAPNTFRFEAIQFPDGSPAYAPFGSSNVSAVNGAVLTTRVEHHIVSVIDSTDTQGGANPNGTMYNYLNGALVGAAPLYVGFTLGALPDVNNWLGRSQWGDPLFDGSFNELRIYDNALSAANVTTNRQLGPNVIPEPATTVLLSATMAAIFAVRRRRPRR